MWPVKFDKNRVYFVGCTHINHKNICKGTSEWSDTSRCRNFSTLEEMNDCIIDNINSIVRKDDTLFHLGDVLFGKKDLFFEFMNRINCRNIVLLFGNHDKYLRSSSRYQSRFVSCQDYLEIKAGGQILNLFHFPIASWCGLGEGFLQLHSHTHGSYPPIGKQLDVGLDNPIGEFKPWSFEKVMDYMNSREIKRVDHHDANTNAY